MGRVQKNKKNAVLIIDSDLAGAEKIKSLQHCTKTNLIQYRR